MASNDYLCSKHGKKTYSFRPGHPPRTCEICDEPLSFLPTFVSVVDDVLGIDEMRSAELQLCHHGERPPTTKSQLRALERREKVDAKKVVGAKRWI